MPEDILSLPFAATHSQCGRYGEHSIGTLSDGFADLDSASLEVPAFEMCP